MALTTGARIGPYELGDLLGAGGMGEVYRARDTKLDRDVAIKVLPERLAADQAALERFEREAKAVAALAHPNILSIYDFGSHEGRDYAVMELLEGETLRERLSEGPLPPRKAAELAGQIARGLGAAHDKGIVHRDLKPENVFVTADGRAKVLDFGLAAVRDAAGSGSGGGADTAVRTRTSLTSPGTVMGTSGYMSPEQVRGLPVDARSDLFSFGAVLFEMLAGRRAFDRETPAETMTAILREEPDEPPPPVAEATPPALMRVVRRCLEKRPEERFQSARDLAFAIENSTDAGVAHSGPHAADAPAPQGVTAPRRSRAGVVAAALVAGALVGLAAGWTLLPRPDSDAATAAPDPVRVRRMTVSGADRDPSASPDGRMIAFTSDRDGTPRIWVKQLAGGGEEALTEGSDGFPRFSPDGSAILFVREEGEQVWLYSQALVGGRARKIVQDAIEGDWSPDGTRIAYLRIGSTGGRREGLIGIADAQRGGGEIIHRVERSLYGLRWSPDGRHLAMVEASVTGNSADYRLLFIDAETGQPVPLGPETYSGPLTPPAWLGDGSLVLARAGTLLGDQGDPLSQVIRRDPRTGRETVLFYAENLFPLQGLRVHSAVFDVLAPDSLVFHETAVGQHLYEMPAASDPPPAGPPPARSLTRGEGRDRQPVWSPDGRRVLFASNRSGNLDLWMLETETGELRQVTDDTAQDWDPAFSPDGKSIVWSSDRNGHLEIWVAAADGTAARRLTDDGLDAENPTFTADGQWVVYWSANPDKLGVWKVRADGSQATRVVPGPFLAPETSPDGRYATFVSLENDVLRSIIGVVDLDTGERLSFEIAIPSPLGGPGVIIGRNRWLPDGSAIAFVGIDERGRTGIFTQDFAPGRDTAATRRPLAGFSPEFVTESFGIAPDGRRVAIAGIRRSFRVMQAEGIPGISR